MCVQSCACSLMHDATIPCEKAGHGQGQGEKRAWAGTGQERKKRGGYKAGRAVTRRLSKRKAAMEDLSVVSRA